MASSAVAHSSIELTDDVDEAPFDDEDFDLDDEGDDNVGEDYDDYGDEDSSGEEEDQGDDSKVQAVQEDDNPAPELRDYYPDVSLKKNDDGPKYSPLNNPASLKGVRLAPGVTLFMRSRMVVENLEIAGHDTLEKPITLVPCGHGPVPRFVIDNSALIMARDHFAQNGYIFRGWVIKDIKMQPSITALIGEFERMHWEEVKKVVSKKSGKRGKSQDKDGSSTVPDFDEGDEPARRVVTVGATADPAKDYLKQIDEAALLNAKQEVKLAKHVGAGLYVEHRLAEEDNGLPAKLHRELHWVAQDGQEAKSHLLEANLRPVVSLVKRHTGHGMLFLGLIQEGNLGLVCAMKRLDYAKGFKFSTCAAWWIRRATTHAVIDQARTIRVPMHMVGVTNKLVRVQCQTLQDLGRGPILGELAVELDVIPEKVVEVQKYGHEPISLHTPLDEDEGFGFGDLIEDSETVIPAGVTSFTLLQRRPHAVPDTLSECEADMVSMRFGLADDQPKTLDEISKAYEVTWECIRQIESKTMSKLCHPPRSQVLRDYLG